MINLGLLRLLIAASTWLMTFAAHSVVAHSGALLLGRRVVRLPRHRDVLWKAALLLPFVTATIASAGWRPAAPIHDVDLPTLVRGVAPATWTDRHVETRIVRIGGADPVVRTFATDTTAAGVAAVVVAVALVTAVVGLWRLSRRRRRFARHLGRRTPAPDGPACHDANIRITRSRSLRVPVALGWREVCLPADIAEMLTDRQQRSVIAHEREHLRRRDPAWFALTDLIAAVAPWQPLLRPIARALRREAEFICDEAVVRESGEGRTLVQALVAFATSLDTGDVSLAASCAGSPLEERARRLLAPRTVAPRRQSDWAIGIALVTLMGIVSLAPALSTHTTPGTPPRGLPRRVLRSVDSTVILRIQE